MTTEEHKTKISHTMALNRKRLTEELKNDSLKPLDEVLKVPPTLFPRNPTFNNFSDLFITLSTNAWVPFSRYVFNTLFITACGTVGPLGAGYVGLRRPFPEIDLGGHAVAIDGRHRKDGGAVDDGQLLVERLRL